MLTLKTKNIPHGRALKRSNNEALTFSNTSNNYLDRTRAHSLASPYYPTYGSVLKVYAVTNESSVTLNLGT